MRKRFRIWDTEQGIYINCDGALNRDIFLSVDGEILETYPGDDGGVEGIRACYSGRYLLEEFIGRPDKNGHNLFQGDIITHENKAIREGRNDSDICTLVITWSDDSLGWVGRENGHGRDIPLPISSFMELVGNVHKKGS